MPENSFITSTWCGEVTPWPKSGFSLCGWRSSKRGNEFIVLLFIPERRFIPKLCKLESRNQSSSRKPAIRNSLTDQSVSFSIFPSEEWNVIIFNLSIYAFQLNRSLRCLAFMLRRLWGSEAERREKHSLSARSAHNEGITIFGIPWYQATHCACEMRKQIKEEWPECQKKVVRARQWNCVCDMMIKWLLIQRIWKPRKICE